MAFGEGAVGWVSPVYRIQCSVQVFLASWCSRRDFCYSFVVDEASCSPVFLSGGEPGLLLEILMVMG